MPEGNQAIPEKASPPLITAAEDEEAAAPMAIPIKVRGSVVGVMDTYKSTDSGEWTEEELAFLETLTEQLGVALDSARLYEETQQRAERERLVAEITGRMRQTLEIDSVLKTAAQEIYQVLGLKRAAIRLSNTAARETVIEGQQEPEPVVEVA
jgi:methyl-accepting chemotaxis protein PixJ